jgi:hypothetical protein
MTNTIQHNYYSNLLSQSQVKRRVLIEKRDRLNQRIAVLDEAIVSFEKRLDPNNVENVWWNPVTERYELTAHSNNKEPL